MKFSKFNRINFTVFTLILGFVMENAFAGKAPETFTAQVAFVTMQEGLGFDWFAKQLKSKSFADSDYKVEPSTLFPGFKQVVSSNLQLIILVNRMRAFLEGPPKKPYVYLNIRDKAGKEVQCVTRFWFRIKADFHWDEEQMLVESLEQDEIKKCKVEGKFSASYGKMSADQLKNTFFNKWGALKISQYPALSEDREFILFLIQHGFYPVIGDEEGYLVIN